MLYVENRKKGIVYGQELKYVLLTKQGICNIPNLYAIYKA